MFRKLGALVAVLASTTLLTFAQAPAPATPGAVPGTAPAGAQPAGRGGGRGAAPIKSPEVAADGRVTFRIRAANAKEVVVPVGGKRLVAEKSDQGVWTATSDVMAPDYYTYSFLVDGNAVNDPSNRAVQTSFGSFQSMVVVPGPQPWLPHPGVARGAITRHAFHSAIANDDRDFYVYTPAGYDARRARAYPILYLLHGLGDDAERWINSGGANVIMDNLIAESKAVPMVMVTTLGYGVSNGPAGASGATAVENITNYPKILLDEVMPRVEKAYHVTNNRDERAIAGLSMGGAEAMFTGLNHLDKFAWLGSFSGAYVMWPRANATPPAPAAPPPPAAAGAAPDGAAPGRGGRGGGPPLDEATFIKNFPTLDAKVNPRIRMLWIVCGTADGLVGVNRQFKAWLTTKGVNFTEQEVPDMGHVWPLWRQNLTDMAQKLFQPKARG
ncbi:MAG: alpha/beta hydrolase-fold protein [Acidobacteriota bacterium]